MRYSKFTRQLINRVAIKCICLMLPALLLTTASLGQQTISPAQTPGTTPQLIMTFDQMEMRDDSTILQDTLSGLNHQLVSVGRRVTLVEDDPFNLPGSKSLSISGANTGDHEKSTHSFIRMGDGATYDQGSNTAGRMTFWSNSKAESNMMTLQAWVKPLQFSQVGYQPVVRLLSGHHANNASTRIWIGFDPQGRFVFRAYAFGAGTNTIDTDFVLPLNEWTHLAMRWRWGEVELYANGNLVYQAEGKKFKRIFPKSRNQGPWVELVTIGSGFTGYIDDVQIARGYMNPDNLGVHRSLSDATSPKSP